MTLLALGAWQLQRAEQKKVYFDQQTQRSKQSPIQVSKVVIGPEKSGWPVEMIGQFEREGQFLWDNRTYEGRAGFHVLTPFMIEGSQVRIFVDRGWIPLEGSREQFPRPDIPVGPQKISGQLYAPLKGFTFVDEAPVFGTPLRQNLDLDALVTSAPYDLQPYVLRLAPDEVGGFVRDWPGPSRTMIQRHQAYAVQWFGMAAVLVLIVISFVWRQRKDSKQGKIRK